MWCDLALALGGRSITEWKAAMSLDEFHTWLQYRAKWGISTIRAIELGAAVTAHTVGGGKFKDYLPNRASNAAIPEGGQVAQAMAMMPGKVMR